MTYFLLCHFNYKMVLMVLSFSWEEALLWVMELHFGQKWCLKVKTLWWIWFLQTRSFLLHKTLFNALDIGVWIIVMFLSAVWTLILTAPIHCRWSTGEQVMQCYISPIFWVNYSFNTLMSKEVSLRRGLFCHNDRLNIHHFTYYTAINNIDTKCWFEFKLFYYVRW